MKNLVCGILLLILVSSSLENAFAKQIGDWNTVINLTGQEIALKTRGGKSVFGVLRAARGAELQIQVADKKSIAARNTTFRRDEIEKIWRARLRFGGRQIGRGALVGAGAGAVIGTGIFLGTVKNNDDGLAGAIIPLGLVYGAGIGALVGVFSKKSHQKSALVYRR